MRKVWFLFPVILLLILASCASTSVTDETTPLSLYKTKRFASENQVFFIGEGQSESQRQAELLAYEDINNKVYRYLGLDPEPESYSELATSGTVSRYNLRIQEKNAYLTNGEITYAIVASADKTLLAQDRSADMQKEEEIAQNAMNLVLEGDAYIKANKDVDGLRCYLKSLALSYGLQYIDEEFSFTTILDEIIDLISVIELKVDSEKPRDASCKVKISRHDTLIPSRIKNASIKAIFTSVDSRGISFEDSSIYITNEKGVLNFVPRAYNIVNDGTVTFKLDLENEINAIEKLSPYTADVLKNLIEEKSCKFDYHREYSSGAVGVSTMCIDYRGNEESSQWVSDFLVEEYSQSEINAFSFGYIEDETESDMLDRFKKENPDCNILVLVKIGTGDVFQTRMNICSVSVEGTVLIYDVNSQDIIYDSGASYANGFGSSIEEAQKEAFSSFVLKMFPLLKANYV